MGEIKYIRTSKENMDILMKIRLEMLLEVNSLPEDHAYDAAFVEATRSYFEMGDQTTIIALDGELPIGCASLSYIWVMPTFSHPSGKRGHLMNVYTNAKYRRQGISKRMVRMLIDEAREKGVTEISLDTTDMGRPLYEALGFAASDECMVMALR